MKNVDVYLLYFVVAEELYRDPGAWKEMVITYETRMLGAVASLRGKVLVAPCVYVSSEVDSTDSRRGVAVIVAEFPA